MANNETRALSRLAGVFKALGHPTRLWIAKRLESGACCVGDIAAATAEGASTISQHLTILKQAGVVESDKQGKNVFYSLRYPCLPWLIRCMEARDGHLSEDPDEARELLSEQLHHLLRLL
ncbi:MAG TPA: metalloregulator ArsR/SmtB family transcription factor [Candidatus Akkermansia intestinigallinarum]|uniref:Metalloregulator ArsR/SmtB family transcription factor n=1 Tax=Candidatus Akkermansia intestinigallinarum TaxID=2838431 RepID=A0A9D1V9G5_9BACT|nr:metalloregulator ArsR/SmtB family transcription factor [Candidatus Akkermansia intestinigallinarum]